MSDMFDIHSEYRRLSMDAAERAGFAVSRPLDAAKPARLAQIANRRRRVLDAVGELQMLTHHADSEIANSALASLHECLGAAVTHGPAPTPRRGLERIFVVADIVVTWLWTFGGHTSRRPEDAEPKLARRLRLALMLSTLLAALVGALFLASGGYAWALFFVLGAVAADLTESAIGRITWTESPVERWLASLISHLSELTVIVGIAWDQQRLGHPRGAAAVLVAGMAAIFGTFVRVSALQAGLCLRRSMAERAVRLLSVLAYIGLAQVWSGTALPTGSGLVAAVLFGSFGLWQTLALGIGKGLPAMRHETIDISLLVADARGGVQVRSVSGKRLPPVLRRAAEDPVCR